MSCVTNIEAVLNCPAGTVRDRLWMWAHPAGSYNTAPNKNEWPFTSYGFEKTSRMTPAEGALYLGVPNVVFVRYIGKPMPSEFEHSARSLSPFKRVVWAINFAPRRKGPVQFNWTSVDEEEHQIIRDMLKRRPNIIGLILDDYFRSSGEKRTATGSAAVAKVKSSFGRAEFWDALYTRDIETTDKAHLDLMDVMTIWTRESKDIPNLESSFERLCQRTPRLRKVLGCYMWDYLGERQPIPLSLMQHQCELGLKWLKAGRIEGVCFIASSMCDMGVEAVEWTRRWIQHVGDQPL